VEVEPAKVALPEYTAVIVSVPAVIPLSVKVATPDEATVAVPSNVVPLKKLTVPVGVPVGVGLTVAVNATGWPATAGFGDAARDVVVGRLVMVSVNVEDVEGCWKNRRC
jgi:hypothetical protein